MKVKLKLADSLTPKEVRQLQKPFNNRIINVGDEDAVFKKLDRDYIAVRTDLREDGYPIYKVQHYTDYPEF